MTNNNFLSQLNLKYQASACTINLKTNPFHKIKFLIFVIFKMVHLDLEFTSLMSTDIHIKCVHDLKDVYDIS